MFAATPNLMADIKARLKPLFRRSPTISSTKSSASPVGSPMGGEKRSRSKSSVKTKSTDRKASVGEPPVQEEEKESTAPPAETAAPATESHTERTDPRKILKAPLESLQSPLPDDNCPVLTLERPTPDLTAGSKKIPEQACLSKGDHENPSEADAQVETVTRKSDAAVSTRPEIGVRRQSLAHSSQTKFLKTLLETDNKLQLKTPTVDYFGGPPTISANMLHRKIWVKRPGSSATLVTIKEDDLVDDVREMILRKYANSLGRNYDAPDVTLRIVPREPIHRHSQGGERTLGPEEPISRTLDAYFPGGQSVDEALLIDVPQRRTPRNSPRHPVPYYMVDDLRPGEAGSDYFPPMSSNNQQSPHLPSNLSVTSGQSVSHPQNVHSIAVLNSGQIPSLPSPGLRTSRHPHQPHRPKFARQNTSSPTIANSGNGSVAHEASKTHPNGIPAIPPMPATPVSAVDSQPNRTQTPPPRSSSPRPKPAHKRSKRGTDHPRLPSGLLDGTVPPINVLIVEDNIINLKLLEAFMKRLKVRWHTAMNGRDAVTKWRAGGFHLVLMDIQLPVMNGLDATKEIRRLERLNNIGVFSNSASNTPTISTEEGKGFIEYIESDEMKEKESKPTGNDFLINTSLFKSPVIIVALTASSLQSDRHEALAAGCNDFLTKPVNFVWLERKVMEWGCMQALIDFDGWRKWKDFSQQTQTSPTSVKVAGSNHAHKVSGAGLPGTPKAGPSAGAKISPVSLRRDKRLSSGAVGSMGTGSHASPGSGNETLDEEGGRTAIVAEA